MIWAQFQRLNTFKYVFACKYLKERNFILFTSAYLWIYRHIVDPNNCEFNEEKQLLKYLNKCFEINS